MEAGSPDLGTGHGVGHTVILLSTGEQEAAHSWLSELLNREVGTPFPRYAGHGGEPPTLLSPLLELQSWQPCWEPASPATS